MSEYKEFTGKSLDEAIKEACDYYALDRGKLELEIISGGSAGIFGLVGKKKAVVKARPRVAQSLTGKPMPRDRKPERAEGRAPEEAPVEARAEGQAEFRAEAKAEVRTEPKPEAGAEAQAEPKAEQRQEGRSESRHGRGRRSRHKKAPRPDFNPEDYGPEDQAGRAAAMAEPRAAVQAEAPAEQAAPRETAMHADEAVDLADDLDEDFGEEAPAVEEKPLDKPELEALLRKTVTMLIEPIVGQVGLRLTQAPDRVRVLIADLGEEESGLLIGRDGQTINAVQYLTNRVVSKQWTEPVRVQIDTGDYRQRQDDKLRKMAYFLASKAKSTGRAQSTKPLSSYHRRVIHMALQADPSVQTRSKGEGPLKRVLILSAKRGGRGGGRGRNGGDGGNGANGGNSGSGDAQA